ncbi:hypothetical protein KBH77_02940 [Patescibacteria group bacterium]|nr:hypothetical protein [Patescibacteria group bacterium]
MNKHWVDKLLTKQSLIAFAKAFGLHVILTAGLTYIISIFLFYIGVKINPLTLPISFAIASYILFFSSSKKRKKHLNIAYLLFTIFLYLVMMTISFKFYDISWDGQEYHQETIFTITDKGWNPIKNYDPPTDTFPGLVTWVKHYPKASEILSSSIYVITQRIESAKAFNLLFILSSFCLSLFFLTKELKINLTQSLLLSFITAFNPVSVYQSLTFYLDGEISSLIICGFILLIMLARTDKKIYLYSFILIITLLINFKSTGIIFSVFLCIEYLLLLLMNKHPLKGVIKKALPLLLAGICAICIFGLNPYVYNTIHFKNPAYPLAGENSIDIMTPNRPPGYDKLNKIERILVSYFMLNVDPNTNRIIPRLPLSNIDLALVQYSDPRIGGFGPFFMEISLLSGISILYFLVQKKYNKTIKYKCFFYCCTIFLLALILPESWWARYIPLIYVIPVIIIIPYIIKSKHLPFIIELLVFFLFINNLYTGAIYTFSTTKYSRQIDQAIEKLRNENSKVYVYKYGEFHNNVQRLKENGIQYEIIEDKNIWESLGEARMIFYTTPFEIKYY